MALHPFKAEIILFHAEENIGKDKETTFDVFLNRMKLGFTQHLQKQMEAQQQKRKYVKTCKPPILKFLYLTWNKSLLIQKQNKKKLPTKWSPIYNGHVFPLFILWDCQLYSALKNLRIEFSSHSTIKVKAQDHKMVL